LGLLTSADTVRKRPADKNEASFLQTLTWLIKRRRLLGLLAFFSGTAAMLTRATFYAESTLDLRWICAEFDLKTALEDIAKRQVHPHRWRQMAAAVVPFLLTSSNWAIRKMGGKSWNRLHKLV
jgi:methionine sulfoxide reductase heme-binding subunit